MNITRHLYDELVTHAQAEAPLECCGVIGCRGGEAIEVWRCTNAAESEVRYEIEGMEQLQVDQQLKRRRLSLGAIYHSHTHGPPEPSEMDIATAFYPDALYVIVGVEDRDFPEVRAFRIRDGVVDEAELVVRG